MSYYDEHADDLVRQYESVSPEAVHRHWIELLPAGGRALDVGAASGRDAAWLAALGFAVVAVEPSETLRSRARELHPAPAITWVDDRLPGLALVGHECFDVILLSGVWMHVDPRQRAAAFQRLSELLTPGGLLVFSMRRGPCEPARGSHPVLDDELVRLAAVQGLSIATDVTSCDSLGRPEVSWRTLVFRNGTALHG